MARTPKNEPLTKVITVRFSEAQTAEIDEVVSSRGYLNQADAIRSLVRDALHPGIDLSVLLDSIRSAVKEELGTKQQE